MQYDMFQLSFCLDANVSPSRTILGGHEKLAVGEFDGTKHDSVIDRIFETITVNVGCKKN